MPVAVCGSSSTNTTSSGIHHFAILPSKNFSNSSRLTSWPGFLIATTIGRSSYFGCRTPITAASCTPGCATAMFSRSMELIHSPPDLITSLERSVICM